MKSTDFVVARQDLQQCKFIETQLPDPAALPDEALLIKIDRFALPPTTSHTPFLGDQLKILAVVSGAGKFGNIPVWGFGEVIASKASGRRNRRTPVRVFPEATHLVIEAADVSKRGLRDAAAHRQGRGAGLQRLCARQRRSRLRPGARAIIKRCCGRCSCCRFWSMIFGGERVLRRAERDALQRLQQDRVRLAHLLHTWRKPIR